MSADYATIAVGQFEGRDRAFITDPEFTREPADQFMRTNLVYSDDAGATGSAPLVIQEPDFAGQTHPTVAVDKAGDVFVTLYHPIEEDGTLEYRAYRVRDGLVGPPTVLGLADARGRTFNLGHYMGLIGLERGAAAAWLEGTTAQPFTTGNHIRLMAATVE